MSLATTSSASAAGHVYWGAQAEGSISRAGADGSGIEEAFVETGGNPGGVAVDNAHLYWVNANGSIGRSKLNGAEVEAEFISNEDAGATFGLAVDEGHIYWRAAKSIGRANINGSEPDIGFIEGVELPEEYAGQLAVDGSHVYWSDEVVTEFSGTFTIARADLDGTNVNRSYVEALASEGLAVGPTYIYWAANGWIRSAKKSSPNSTIRVIAETEEGEGIGGLALGPHYLFWSHGAKGEGPPESEIARGTLFFDIILGGAGKDLIAAPAEGPPGSVALDPGTELAPVCQELPLELPADEPKPVDLSTACSHDESWPVEGGTPTSFELLSEPAHGSISEFDPETGHLIYEPDHRFVGEDSFAFAAGNDVAASPETVVSLDVKAPEPPSCEPRSIKGFANEAIESSLLCSGERYEFALDSEPAHGTISEFDVESGTFTYTPDEDYVGADSFTFHAENAGGSAETQMVEIAVAAISCSDEFWTTGIDEPVEVELACEGPSPIEFELLSEPEYGSISEFNPATGALLYTPPEGFSGEDWLTFKAKNKLGSSEELYLDLAVGNRPSCEGVAAQTPPEQPVPITLECSGAVGEPFYEIEQQPEHGSISEFSRWEPTLTYTPEPGFGGSDSFTYRSYDAIGGSNEATVSIEVEPFCEDVESSTVEGEPVELQLACEGKAPLLFETLSAPEFGALSELDEEAGTVLYTPESGFSGQDSFAFGAENGVGKSNQASASVVVCSRPELEVSGEVAEDEVPGVDLEIKALPGEHPCEVEGEVSRVDALRLYIDEELIYSEERKCDGPEDPCWPGRWSRTLQLPYPKVIGSHEYRAEAENQFGLKAASKVWSKDTPEEGTVFDLTKDDLKGECHKPKQIKKTVIGTNCADTIGPHGEADLYRGRGGNDHIYGSGAPETIRGEKGEDFIMAGRGSDFVFGEEESDEILGGSGDDLVRGGAGDNTLLGGPGADTIIGGGGNDFVQGGATTDKLRGGGGTDTLSYADAVTPGFFLALGSGPLTAEVPGFPKKHESRGVLVNLSASHRFGDNGETARYGGGTDQILDGSFKNVIGSPFADLIIGSNEKNEIVAGGGTDIVRGGGEDDTIIGGSEEDYLDGEEGNDVINGGTGTEDTCLDAASVSNCESSSPEATLVQPSGEMLGVGMMESGSESARQDLYLRGSSAPDSVTAAWSSGVVVLTAKGGGTFDPAENGTAGCTIPEGGEKAECSAPSLDSILMYGGPKDDRLKVEGVPKSVSVELFGGDGNDHLTGGAESEDVLVDGPGDGNDVLKGLGGDDTLFSNEGKDNLMAGGDNDLFVSSALCEGDAIRGENGADNANWAQLYGPEIEKENYPEKLDDDVYAPVAHGAKVRLTGGTVSKQGIGCHESEQENGDISGVENLEGSPGPDVLVGNSESNVILGRSGSDVLRGRAGNDSILANNRNPTKFATPLGKLDLDKRLECGAGTDAIKLDPADKRHFPLAQLKGCETKEGHLVKPPRNFDRTAGGAPGGESEEIHPGEALDERVIGGLDDAGAAEPLAFFRLDESTGTDAVDWSDPAGEEEEIEEEEGESEEEVIELEEEEAEEAEEEFEGESESSEEEPHTGDYVNGVELGQAGVMEESSAVHLDGVNDHVDLTSAWDPSEFAYESCAVFPIGYSVAMWVRFDGSADGREELFSRVEGSNGISVYRTSDGRLNFSVADAIESPTVSTDEPVSDEGWHQVVATIADETGGCASRSARSLSPEGSGEESTPRLTLVVDGFSYSLGIGERSPFPQETPSAHNIVGAREGESGFSNWLAGTVDDVAIYGEQLSFDEAQVQLAVSEALEPSAYLEPPADPNDADEDGVSDSLDNCPKTANAEQVDADLDGIGDACQPEPDGDEDGIADAIDNCPDEPNPIQEDENENGVGDVCEAAE